MESTEGLKTAEMQKERKHALMQWLAVDCGLNQMTLAEMPGDASFRRYYRLHTGGDSFVVMDAPPPQENCRPFVSIAKALRALGLNAPEIIRENCDQGFLLLTDLGDATYLKTLNPSNADQLYGKALDALAVLQRCRDVPGKSIPPFTREFMRQEWDWHKEWFAKKLLGLDLSEEKELDACYALLVESAASQPQVFMHRDYHSANLMLLENNDVGLLDFQDAFMGPVTYDLASLLRDCYIDWPQEKVVDWALFYWQKLQTLHVIQVDQKQFLRWFDLMGVQRHLKALLTFARKQVRDHQPHYLKHIPRTLNYLVNVTRDYPELAALYDYVQKKAKPAFDAEIMQCVR